MNKKTPLISVIIPVYNAEKTLKRALDSLFVQNYPNIEIIAINDGSKDGSLEILNQLKPKHKNLVVINQPNGGASKARNAGLDSAKGEFVGFLDADDEMPSDYFSKMIKGIGDADLAFSGFQNVKNGKATVGSNPDGEPFPAKDYIRYLFDPSKYGIQGSVWDKLFRRKLIEEHHIRFNEQFAFFEDLVFVFEYCRHANNVAPVKDNLYLYYIHSESTLGSVATNPKATTFIDSCKYLLVGSGYPWSKVEKGFVAYMGFHYVYYYVYRYLPKSELKKSVKQEIKSFERTAKNKKECVITPFIRFKMLVHKILFR